MHFNTWWENLHDPHNIFRDTQGLMFLLVITWSLGCSCLFIYLFIYCLFVSSRAAPVAYGGSQARGGIGAIVTGLRHSHSNTGSEPCLQSTPQLTATPDP